MNSFRSLVYPSARSNATGLICRDSGLVHVVLSETDRFEGRHNADRLPFTPSRLAIDRCPQ